MRFIRRWIWFGFAIGVIASTEMAVGQSATTIKPAPRAEPFSPSIAGSPDCIKKPDLNREPRAKELINNLLKKSGIPADSVSSIVDNKSPFSAKATSYCNLPVIYFNSNFLDRISKSSKTDWSMYSVAAHELGHIVSLHSIHAGRKSKHQLELEADYFSGYTLARLGAGIDETRSAIRSLPSSPVTVALNTTRKDMRYPELSEREDMVEKGWIAAKRNETHRASKDLTDLGEIADKYITKENTDIYGRYYKSRVAKNLKDCARFCLDDAKCVSVSYDKWSGWCFQNDANGKTNVDAKSIIAIRKPHAMPQPVNQAVAKTDISPSNDYEVYGPDPKPSEAMDAAACKKTCEDDPECHAFSFNKEDKSKEKIRCHTLTKPSGNYFNPKYISGYKQQKLNAAPK